MHHKLLTARLKHNKTPPPSKQPLLPKDDSAKLTMTAAESSIDHAPLNSSLSQIINMELGGPESAESTGNPSPSAAALAQARLIAAEEASLSHQAKLAAAAQIMAAQQQSSALHRHQQLEQIRQLQAMQQLSFLYPPAATPPPLGSSYLMEAILARQQQEQQFLAAVSANAAAVELARAARTALPATTSSSPPPPQPTGSSTDLESSLSSSRGKVAAPIVSPKRAVDKLPDDLVASSKKKQKREPAPSGEGDDDDSSKGHRFRPYQYEQWTEKFQELTDFRKEKGHCQVPHTYTENPPLARWVKRQRYQYKLKMENKQSTMTDERVDLLENIGFIWDSHAAAWAEKLHELKEYAELRGDCNVPSTFPDNPQLATWVKCQRRQYKLLRDGKTSNMTVDRIKELESIGFVWEVRKSWENTRK